ncbi:unnamed protein product [Allacma fusca]|uniref:Uncharacterized protein n=1 Tax=Allacma fusca TaxID=39272 RepID=A0A8J2LXN0_9HEXA|nr:unnamed protein product [Allacma fusca]
MNAVDAKITQVLSKLGYTYDNQPNEMHESITSTLYDLARALKSIECIHWSNRIEDLIGALKMYIIFYDRRQQLMNLGDNYFLNAERTIIKGVKLGSVACEVLGLICDLLSSKDSYNFFSAFVLKQSPSSYSLMEIFRLNEPNLDNRLSVYIAYNSVINVLMKAVQKAKPTLGFAESKNVQNYPATYTAFSMTMAFALEDILNTLIAVIDQQLPRIDCNAVCEVLVQVAESCPFHRLHSSVFKCSVDFLDRQLQHRPLHIQRRHLLKLAIICVSQNNKFVGSDLGALFKPVLLSRNNGTSDPSGTCGELDKPIQVSHIIVKSISFLNYWMTAAVLGSENIKTSNELVLLDLELITSLTKNYFHSFKHDSLMCLKSSIYILSILPIIMSKFAEPRNFSVQVKEKELFDMKIAVVCQALQFMVELAIAVSRYADESELVDENFITEFVELWDLFFDLAPELMDVEVMSVRKGVADCFAAFGSGLFERIPLERQRFCIVSVLGWCRDDRHTVRAKGGRCIAHLVGQRLLAEDEHFLLDALDVMEESLNNGDLATRGSFAWCLGNFTESLLLYHRDRFPPNFSDKDFYRLCKLCFDCAQDKAKIRYNAHRALGNLLGWVPLHLLSDSSDHRVVDQSVHVLLKQIGSGNDFKARWNASHAMGMILQNEQLLKTHSHLLGPVLKHMARVVYKSENYKERNQCVFTLTTIKTRSLYGNLYFAAWQGILQSLNVPDDLRPTEMTQVEKLQMEVCLGVCHLISLLELEDLRELESVIENSVDILRDIFTTRQVIPERIHHISSAREHLQELLTANNCSYEDRETLLLYPAQSTIKPTALQMDPIYV